MRFKLKLFIDKQVYGNTLPFNYQYECSAVIYKIMAKSDTAFSEWLHNNGYHADKKQFKLFTYSRLQIPKFTVQGSYMKILSDELGWNISFIPESSTQQFIQGIFGEQEFELGNRHARIHCRVQQIELSPPPLFTEKMQFGLLSPMCITLKHPDQTEEYIAPDHPQANALIRQNLLDKHKAWLGTEYQEKDFPFEIKTLTKPKTALITIKAETPHESKIRGYMCDFEMTAPVQLMKIMYEGGIGGKNSMGFGMVKSI